jgi:hypothetical protein
MDRFHSSSPASGRANSSGSRSTANDTAPPRWKSTPCTDGYAAPIPTTSERVQNCEAAPFNLRCTITLMRYAEDPSIECHHIPTEQAHQPVPVFGTSASAARRSSTCQKPCQFRVTNTIRIGNHQPGVGYVPYPSRLCFFFSHPLLGLRRKACSLLFGRVSGARC